jgi:hypothetical protein
LFKFLIPTYFNHPKFNLNFMFALNFGTVNLCEFLFFN